MEQERQGINLKEEVEKTLEAGMSLMSELPLMLQKVISEKMIEAITLEVVAQTSRGLKQEK